MGATPCPRSSLRSEYIRPRYVHCLKDVVYRIDTVQPTTDFSVPRRYRAVSFTKTDSKALVAAEATSCNVTVTIACLQQLYKTGGYIPNSTSLGQFVYAPQQSGF